MRTFTHTVVSGLGFVIRIESTEAHMPVAVLEQVARDVDAGWRAYMDAEIERSIRGNGGGEPVGLIASMQERMQ